MATLPIAHTHLVAALEAIRDTVAPELHVFPFWRADMALPAAWLWLAPGDVPPGREGRPDTCTVINRDRIVVSIGADPAADLADDARTLMDYVQLVREQLDPQLYGPAPLGGVQRAAWAPGAQMVNDRLGDVQVLTVELPVDVDTRRRFVIP